MSTLRRKRNLSEILSDDEEVENVSPNRKRRRKNKLNTNTNDEESDEESDGSEYDPEDDIIKQEPKCLSKPSAKSSSESDDEETKWNCNQIRQKIRRLVVTPGPISFSQF